MKPDDHPRDQPRAPQEVVRPYDCAVIAGLVGTANAPRLCSGCADASNCVYLKALYLTAYRIVCNYRVNAPRELAQDVVQEALLAARTKGQTLEQHPDIVGWLHQAVIHQARNAVRKHDNRIAGGAPPPEPSDPSMPFWEVVMNEELYRMVEEAVAMLPPDQAELWRQHYGHGMARTALPAHYNQAFPDTMKTPAEIKGLLDRAEWRVSQIVRQRLIFEGDVAPPFVALYALCLQVLKEHYRLSQEQLVEQINACPPGHPEGKFKQPLVSHLLNFHHLTSTPEADKPYLNALACFFVRSANDCITAPMVAKITASNPRMDAMKARRVVHVFWADVQRRAYGCCHSRGDE